MSAFSHSFLKVVHCICNHVLRQLTALMLFKAETEQGNHVANKLIM